MAVEDELVDTWDILAVNALQISHSATVILPVLIPPTKVLDHSNKAFKPELPTPNIAINKLDIDNNIKLYKIIEITLIIG